ncbi:MAG TPA: acyltransferase family protein [Solirubrobacteraceae bacterium]|nr:acyltransferase family protein [Solirubrobacteraceae bacterium]
MDPARLPETKRSRRRPEIQALRAIAVLTVVLYHIWPEAMPGGFVGVDVFFAISGYLITAHLLREVESTGALALWGFWARRARRLLPAALLTLFVCAVGTLLFVPQVYWQQFLTEIAASTAYFQNWQLAGDAVDYLAADNRASPVQHFWSLSAEEQFYLAWPLLIALGAWLSRSRAAIFAVLGLVTALSLAYSITETASNPAAAYFVTPTRAWEFGAGGLLALLGARAWQLPDAVRAALSWAGLLAVLYAAVFYSTDTAFPGSAALVPVLGTLAVILAGTPRARWAPSPMLRFKPGQFLGDISYSVYLWHWPLLVFAPFILVKPGLDETRVTVVVLTVLLGWVTKVLVEDPVRRSAWLSSQPRMTFACSVAAMAVVAGVLASGATHVQAQIHEAERESSRLADHRPPCFGAAARDPEKPCVNPALRNEVAPLPVAAKTEEYAPCERFHREGGLSQCDFGVAPAKASRTIALVGDSHASHWRTPLDAVANRNGWHGVSITRTSCPFSEATKHLAEPTRSQCQDWVEKLPGYFREHPEIDTIFVVGITGGTVNVPRGRTMFEAKVNGVRKAWRKLPDSVKHIVVIRDTPRIAGDTVDCIDRALADGERADLACAVPRRAALEADPQAVAARLSGSSRMQVIDLTHRFCSKRLCFPVVGGALVFKDLHHFTLVWAETLGPPLMREVERIQQSW